MKEQRIVFIDYIRVIACFLVMLVHASENFYAADASGLAIDLGRHRVDGADFPLSGTVCFS